MQDLVSIIILNYNGFDFIEKLLKSLCDQTYDNFEIIFVDNASTDMSLESLHNLLEKVPFSELRLKTVCNSENLGFCKGNNIGLTYAEGKHVVFLNNDTYVSPIWLENLIHIMNLDEHIGICQSRIIFAQTGEIQTDGWLLDVYGWFHRAAIKRDNSSEFLTNLFYASATSMIVRKDFLLKIGGFDSQLFAGDFDLSWRFRLLGYTVVCAPKSLCYHYGSIATKELVPQTQLTYHGHKEILRVLLKNYSADNLVRRIIPCLSLILIQAFYISLKFKNPSYLKASFKAIIWNIGHLSNTLICRNTIQKYRKISDREIQCKLLPFSVLLYQFKILLR